MYIMKAPTHVYQTIHDMCEEKITELNNLAHSAHVEHMPEELRTNFRIECERQIDDVCDVLDILNTQLIKEN